jgi:cytochrome c biogenesis protein CcdA/thiol-disulfide isomerase/thioredoxin
VNATLAAVAFLGGVLTIASPCVWPVLPFVFSRAGRPFASHGGPMLLGLALAFAGVASLAAIGGAWAVALNQYGRFAAIAWIALCGCALLWPPLADMLSRPFVALGQRLSAGPPGDPARHAGVLSSALLGLATGLLWTPCAGPILGLILAGATLNGASATTSLLLLAYAAGACTSLGAALVLGGRLRSLVRTPAVSGAAIRRVAGAGILVGVALIATGIDTRLLSRISLAAPAGLEQSLVEQVRPGPRPASPLAQRVALSAPRVLSEGDFPSLAGATEWIGSEPLTPQALRGKVVLVDFWTYSCINCLRTLPYVRAWAQKYRAAGLVVVGVHAPEFAFEKRPENVRRAVADLGVGFPVAVDSHHAVWRAFGNQYWPAFYFIDAQGRVRDHQFGEGGYQRAEQLIQQLLAEAGGVVPSGAVSPQGQGVEAAAAPTPARSQESYLGYERADGFASPGRLERDRTRAYASVASLARDQWALDGPWTAERDRVVSAAAHGRIAYRYQARDLHLVLGPAADGRPVHFQVRIDGRPPLADHGFDTDAQGRGTIDGQRLYQLVRQRAGSGERSFEIEFLEPGAQAYAFTFG